MGLQESGYGTTPPALLSRRALLGSPAAALIGSLAAGAGGCGGPAATAPGGARRLSPAKLEVWIWWKEPAEAVTDILHTFTKANPQLAATLEVPPSYWDKVQASLAGGAGPDVFFMNNVNYWVFANKGLLADLTAKVTADANGKDYLKHVWQPAMKFYTFKGKMFGLPFMMNSIITLYNESAIKAAGLKPPTELGTGWTWDRMEEYAVKLTQRTGDSGGTWGAYAARGIENGWLNYVRANGGDYLSPDARRCIIDQPASAAAWEFLAGLVLKHRVTPPPEVLKQGGPDVLLGSGRLIMYTTSTSGAKTFKVAHPNPGFEWNYAVIPFSPTTRRSGGVTNIQAWVQNREGKAPDQCWALLSHMLTKESQDTMARGNVNRPAREDSAQVYYDPKLMGGPPNRKAAWEMFQWTTPLPTHETVTWGEMVAPASKWEADMFDGVVSIKDGLRQMAAEVNALFAKAGA